MLLAGATETYRRVQKCSCLCGVLGDRRYVHIGAVMGGTQSVSWQLTPG
jgi:hypothetical protein